MLPLVFDTSAAVPADVSPIPANVNPELSGELFKENIDQQSLSVIEVQESAVLFSSKKNIKTDHPHTRSQTISQSPDNAVLDEAQLFEQVFGQPSELYSTQIEVPLILNGRFAGNIFVHPHNEVVHITIAGNAFLTLAQDSLGESTQKNVQLAIAADDQLSLSILQSEGLEVNFDRRRLELQVNVPSELRLTNTHSLNVPPDNPGEFALTLPGQLSGYLNLRGNQKINWTDDTRLEPLGLQFDGAINWQGWVLEAYGQATVGQSWQFDRLSVVRDAPDQAIRYTFGDLSVPTAGYQMSPSLLGVSAARNFSLQPFRVARPTSRYSFFLERPSTVEVFVNDNLITTLRLEAGPQDIRDLPLKTGINDIRLKIANDLGQTETLNFSTGIAGDLLAEGVHQFAYNAGFPTIEQQPLKSYDLSRPTLSMFHRVGFTPNLTLGGYLQGDITQQMAGLNGTWATTVGNFGWDMAASNHTDYGVDIAGKLFYEWLEASQNSSQNRQLRLALEYRGEDFSILGQDTPQNKTALNVSFAYQQTLFENIQARFNGEYQIKREGSDAYNIGVSLARPFAQGLNVNLGYHYGQDSSSETNHRFSIGFNGALPFSGQRFNTRTEFNNTLEPQNSLNWSYSPNHTLGAITPNLTLTQSPQSYGLNGRLQYQGYRSSVGLNHQFTLPRDQKDSIESSSTVTWGTAIAFVDGIWGWSRPIDNSFALISRQGSAVGETIKVNPTLSGDMAQANGTGPAVLSMAPYTLTEVSLDAPSLSLGEDLGQTSYQLLPTYRSGTLITTGTEATVFLRGVLVDQRQEPVTLQQGWIESLSDSNWPAIEFFTNRTGRFVAPGLKPGIYRLHLSKNDGENLEFEIPEQQQGNFDIGTLQLFETVPAAQNDI
ncbi:fimbria/pilus outer membrane usher protein [Leptothoe sp. EHU-05/26/07-4]